MTTTNKLNGSKIGPLTEQRCDICDGKLTSYSKNVLGWLICGALACRVGAVKRGQA